MKDNSDVSRREFLRTSAATAIVVATGHAVAAGQSGPGASKIGDADSQPAVLPRRKLGRTGAEVTILAQGAAFPISERHLDIMHDFGIRVIDTAANYLQGNAERTIGQWFHNSGHRAEHFLIDKDMPRSPDEMTRMIDQRLDLLQADCMDLFLLGGMGDSDHYHGLRDAAWFKDKEWTAAIERARRSGKCRFVGFSTHTEPIEIRRSMLEAAARGGWVDAIMVSADPLVLRDNAPFARAIDACHKAGIGLISMKQSRSGAAGIAEVMPYFEKQGLNAHTAVLTGMWTDERFACVCSHMNTFEKLKENTSACRRFKPFTKDELGMLDTMLRGAKRTFCMGCDGRCRRAAGTNADLNTIARYVNYAEQDGRVDEARALLLRMPPDARNCLGADLTAAQRACRSHLDFSRIVRRAGDLLA
jgi:predicted aldo/keto reductase-like oxidoreductase